MPNMGYLPDSLPGDVEVGWVKSTPAVSGRLKDPIKELTRATGKRIKKKEINLCLKFSFAYLKAS